MTEIERLEKRVEDLEETVQVMAKILAKQLSINKKISDTIATLAGIGGGKTNAQM